MNSLRSLVNMNLIQIGRSIVRATYTNRETNAQTVWIINTEQALLDRNSKYQPIRTSPPAVAEKYQWIEQAINSIMTRNHQIIQARQ